jgi:hypothetical protein
MATDTKVRRFEGVTMGNRGCGGGITAWKGGETPGESPRCVSEGYL